MGYHPDDEFGHAWVPDADDWLLNAANALIQRNDARPLVEALLNLKMLPSTTHYLLRLWLDGELLPDPKLSYENSCLRDAVRAYRQTPFLRNAKGKVCESAAQKRQRVLDTLPSYNPGQWQREGGVTVGQIKLVINGNSRARENILAYEDAISRSMGVEPSRRR